ncbi:hypothetical protein Salat_1152000 [Sesamum alatum]|uniref:Uncharacterized protein n=1 Tax=Sesamum alatum TaxID=300844 RepID=A0AAE2CNC1_9LAMI|nr:hypothetical protein Salat_1152000 [Sesamum alatum]
MKGREVKGPPATADLLPSSRHHLHHHYRHLRYRQTRNRGGGGSYGSPLLWAKGKHTNADIPEPTSPKVTCVGHIKVIRQKSSSCKNWQSLMEEIERLHNDLKHRRRPLGFRSIRFRCFRTEIGSVASEQRSVLIMTKKTMRKI